MKNKSKEIEKQKDTNNINNVYIEEMGIIKDQPLTETLETNYMPYAMSVILSRAIPEIDGFKPSHRKLLYTMYKMGLLTGAKTKSANVVGQTMRLNPHGDAAIYETMVRLSKGNESLLNPFIKSKGNFGKVYSRDMTYAASRYTEVKLSEICEYVFEDIDKDTINFVDNYDNTMKEPQLLPVAFPNILANPNLGIAVGMASCICPFNLRELCKTTIALIKNPDYDIMEMQLIPDFSTGGEILLDKKTMSEIYATGRGSFRVRAIYKYDHKSNCIEIMEIPPTTTIEAIVDKIVDGIKDGKLKEISDIRDETDLNGLKITIDLKRGTNYERFIKKLFKLTPLEDSFSCNFNVLIGAEPKVLGVKDIIKHWIKFRKICVRRKLKFDFDKNKEKLSLLLGLRKILLNVDKAIKIIRETQKDIDVIPNLMKEFELNKFQAEFVAEIKLRNLNREYILKRTEEITKLEDEIKWIEKALTDDQMINQIIIDKLNEITQKYGKKRKSSFVITKIAKTENITEEPQNFPVHLFVTRDGYIKKILVQSLRMNSEQKLKQDDEIILEYKSSNNAELLVFTNMAQVYKLKCYNLVETKASALGEFLPAKLAMEQGEMPIFVLPTVDFSGNLILAFENGKFAKIKLSSYKTATNRKKLIKAYSQKSPLVFITLITEDTNFVVYSKQKKILVFSTALLNEKMTRDTQGVQVIRLRKNDTVAMVKYAVKVDIKSISKYVVEAIPRAGISEETAQLQMNL